MTINVGELIYVLDVKTHTVVPCKIVEKVSSIKIDGEEVHHMAETPAGKNFKLESCKNPWFVTIEDSCDFLKSAAEKLISDTIQKTQKVAERSFGENIKSVDELDILSTQVSSNGKLSSSGENDLVNEMQSLNKSIQVDLGSGQVANVSLPDELLNAESTSN